MDNTITMPRAETRVSVDYESLHDLLNYIRDLNPSPRIIMHVRRIESEIERQIVKEGLDVKKK